MTSSAATLTIRLAGPADRETVHRLARLDQQVAPDGTVLLALVDDAPRAAMSVETGAAVSDPFVPTADVVAALRARAALLRGAPRTSRVAALRSTLLRVRGPRVVPPHAR